MLPRAATPLRLHQNRVRDGWLFDRSGSRCPPSVLLVLSTCTETVLVRSGKDCPRHLTEGRGTKLAQTQSEGLT